MSSVLDHRTRMCGVQLLLLLIIFLLIAEHASAQQKPPRPIGVYVNPADGLKFGAFFQGVMGGTVIIYPDGSRSTTGDVIGASLGMPFSPAIIEVEAEPGTRISIMNGPDATLSGSAGGTLTLHIGPSNLGTPFVTSVPPPGRTQVRIGGTLTVGTALANPVGAYSGFFTVTFIQE